MFNWITGPRITNAIEDVQTDPAYESTFIEAPETPAHQFAVKAFKHALFGTPAPEDPNNPSKKLEKKAKLDLANTKSAEIPAPKENAPTMSPSKQPGGILLTPGTTGKGRKTVSFGSQVVDNEGKRGNVGKSGIPNDCPGKFPSPWTPGTQLKSDVESDKKPRTKLTEALMDARSNTKPKTTQKPKAKDDIDITLDLSAPRSESGKFWKERYDQYAESSEKEMKKIVAKQQLAKNYAKKKDAEVTELVTRLEQERKRFRRREQELEQQNKDYQERLRQTMGENASANIEIAGLKARIAMLEKSIVEPSSEMHNSRGAFNIFEDTSKEAIHSHLESQNAPELVSFAPSPSMASSGKENSPPKLRHMRRQTLPNSASHPASSHATRSKLGTDVGEVSILLGKFPHSSAKPSAAIEKPTLAPAFVEQTQSSLHSFRKPEASKENVLLKSPAATGLRSSPLPLPTPEADPWMGVADIEESHIPQLDRMALPISSGPSYSKPTRPIQSRQPTHRVSKSVPHAVKTEAPRSRHQNEKSVLKDEKVDGPGPVSHIRDHISRNAKTGENKFVKKPGENSLHVDIHTTLLSPADPKFDLSKITGHHAEGSSKVTKDRAEMPVDRKAEARRRIDAKKKAKKNGAN